MFKYSLLISIFLAWFVPYHVYAQTSSSIHKIVGNTNKSRNADSARQKDLVDVIRSIGKHKKDSTAIPPAQASKYHFSIVPAIGYTLSTGFAAILAGNVGFYTYDPDKTNISSITEQVVYSQYSQLTIPIQANIWTRDNKYNFVGDWRFYKYPQDTYGLGGHTSLDDADDIDYSHIRIHQSLLRNVAPGFYAGAGYFLDYHWNVKESGLGNDSTSDAKKYGLPTKSMSSGPVINFLFDNRKNSINPQGGLYANLLYRPNLTILGSNTNWQSLTIDVRKYFKLSPGINQNILAFWAYAWLTPSGNPPYLDLPSTGWDAYNNTGRGYIQGRFRGKNMLYLESEYRFGISQNGLFGGVVFANAESFSNYPSNDFDKIWPAVGLGLRIKVNKHSNTNIAIDYGFGADGSRGFFVNLGEVF